MDAKPKSGADSITEMTYKGETCVLSDGRKVKILVCKGRHVPIVISFLQAIISDLGISKNTKASLIAIKDRIQDTEFILQIFAKRYTDVLTVLSAMTEEEEKTLDDMDLDDLLAIVVKVVEVNKRFFTDRVLPLLANVLPETKEASLTEQMTLPLPS